MSKSGETIWSLQILRFVAALMVVYFHAMHTAFVITGGSTGVVPLSIIKVGSAGVDIFFVISGFIIATIAPGKAPMEFARSRFFRVVPLYWICSIPALVALLSTGLDWRHGISTVLLWPATDRMIAPNLGPAWSLCFEMLFYVAATLVLFSRRWLYILVTVFAVAFTLRPFGPVFKFVGNPIILEFVFGVVIAHTAKIRCGVLALPIGAAALLIAGFFGMVGNEADVDAVLSGDGTLPRAIIAGIPAALIVYGTIHVRAKPGIMTYLGGASYSLYLTHLFPAKTLLLMWWPQIRHPEIIALIGITMAVLLAWRVHEAVERPLLGAFRIRAPFLVPKAA